MRPSLVPRPACGGLGTRLMATQAAVSGAGRLVGKVVFITGAAQGIGRATALVGVRACAG